VTLFVCIVLVVLINAGTKWVEHRSRPSSELTPRDTIALRVYVGLSALMLVTAGVAGALNTRWDHSMLLVEVVVLLGFLAFWAVQSAELWNHGRRRFDDTPQTFPFRLDELRDAMRPTTSPSARRPPPA
jgi:hypothetical protein